MENDINKVSFEFGKQSLITVCPICRKYIYGIGTISFNPADSKGEATRVIKCDDCGCEIRVPVEFQLNYDG